MKLHQKSGSSGGAGGILSSPGSSGSAGTGTVSGCGTPSIPPVFVVKSTTDPPPPGKKYINVHLLTRDHLYVAVDVKCKIRDIFDCVCEYLNFQESRLFGLCCFLSGEYRFLDFNEKLNKCATLKQWSKSAGTGAANSSVIVYLRVHTYVDCVRFIKCSKALHHYYLQLRENVRVQWEPSWIREEKCFEAASLALQADFGDFDPKRHLAEYFRPDLYFPMWVVNGRGMDFFTRNMPVMHQDLQGLDRDEAKIRFCLEVSRPPWPVNMHLYSLRKTKQDTQDNVYLGVTTESLEFFEQKPNGERDRISSFPWAKMSKLAFDRRKFSIFSEKDGKRLVYYTQSDEKSFYLLQFCRSFHQNVMFLRDELVEARKREVQESRKLYRESLIITDSADLEWFRLHSSQINFCDCTNISSLNLPSSCTFEGGQRVSLVSDASSNTTSGIVSDRQHNHDDSENDNDDDIDFEAYGDSTTTTTNCVTLSNDVSSGLAGNGSATSSSCSHYLPAHSCNTTSANQASSTTTVVTVDHHQSSASPSGSDENLHRNHNVFREDDGDESSLLNDERNVIPAGPSSDRTVTALSEDGQSVCTTSTTEKLDDVTDLDSLCPSERKHSSAFSEPPRLCDIERLAELAQEAEDAISSGISMLKSNLDENFNNKENLLINDDVISGKFSRDDVTCQHHDQPSSSFSIAELRNRTLNGYIVGSKMNTTDKKCFELPTIVQKDISSAGMKNENCSSTAVGPTNPAIESYSDIPTTSSGRSMKSLATQANSSYFSCFKQTGSTISQHGDNNKYANNNYSFPDPNNCASYAPCVVLVNSKHTNVIKDSAEHQQQHLIPVAERKAYRIVSALASADDSEAEAECLESDPSALYPSNTSFLLAAESANNGSPSKSRDFDDASTPIGHPETTSHHQNHSATSNLVTNQNGAGQATSRSSHVMTTGHQPSLTNVADMLKQELAAAPPEPPPPDYHQAMLQKAERNNKRWPTITDGVDLRTMAQLNYLDRTRYMQQAQSEPGLAEGAFILDQSDAVGCDGRHLTATANGVNSHNNNNNFRSGVVASYTELPFKCAAYNPQSPSGRFYDANFVVDQNSFALNSIRPSTSRSKHSQQQPTNSLGCLYFNNNNTNNNSRINEYANFASTSSSSSFAYCCGNKCKHSNCQGNHSNGNYCNGSSCNHGNGPCGNHGNGICGYHGNGCFPSPHNGLYLKQQQYRGGLSNGNISNIAAGCQGTAAAQQFCRQFRFYQQHPSSSSYYPLQHYGGQGLPHHNHHRHPTVNRVQSMQISRLHGGAPSRPSPSSRGQQQQLFRPYMQGGFVTGDTDDSHVTPTEEYDRRLHRRCSDTKYHESMMNAAAGDHSNLLFSNGGSKMTSSILASSQSFEPNHRNHLHPYHQDQRKNSNNSTGSAVSGNFCTECQENHQQSDSVDLDELKNIIKRTQDVDLPMIRALCDDTSLADVHRSQTNSRSRLADEIDNSNVVDGNAPSGQGQHQKQQQNRYAPPPLDLSASVENRPLSWHESSFITASMQPSRSVVIPTTQQDSDVDGSTNFLTAASFQHNNKLQYRQQQQRLCPSCDDHLPHHIANHAWLNQLVPSYSSPPQSPMRFASTPNLAVTTAAEFILPPPPPYPSASCRSVLPEDEKIFIELASSSSKTFGTNHLFYGGNAMTNFCQYNAANNNLLYHEQAIR